MYAFRLCQKLWRVFLSEEEMIDCSGDPGYRSVRNGKDVIPFDHLLYSQPFCELLVLKAQIGNLFFIFDLLEQIGESICAYY